jgi:cell division inhibitor SulA
MHELISDLQNKQLIWKGNRVDSPGEYQATGFPELDQRLGGGFPTSGVIDIQSQQGIGELRLLMPYVQKHAAQRLFVLINPPGYLCAEYLYAQGIAPSQVLLIYPDSPQHALWAAEQCLKSGACCGVCLWHSGIEIHQAKRLQVASDIGHCLQFLFKPELNQGDSQVFSLPVSLSLTLAPHDMGLSVSITKRKGGFVRDQFVIDMHDRWPELTRTHQSSPSTVVAFPMRQQG